ncbi:hypothetical protein RHSIM_Rhsim06G0178300 [Rhododendron simsii]|uniref:Uncharacterized protein n=1 Tax=Rhododendron simsii TaxID=118357 RepID=A0A834GY74_RHOSS|nr:hypothetical protein RHSIM_Rhsim06G0178300 [Rhododendron simsii]
MDLKFMLMLLLLAACVVNSSNAAGNRALLSAPDPVAVFASPDHDLAGYHATAEKAFLAGPRLPPIEERVTSPPPIDRLFITSSPPDDVDFTENKAIFPKNPALPDGPILGLYGGRTLPPIEEGTTSTPSIDRHFITTSPPDDLDSTKKKALCAGPILPPIEEVTSPPPNHGHFIIIPYPPDNPDSTKH